MVSGYAFLQAAFALVQDRRFTTLNRVFHRIISELDSFTPRLVVSDFEQVFQKLIAENENFQGNCCKIPHSRSTIEFQSFRSPIQVLLVPSGSELRQGGQGQDRWTMDEGQEVVPSRGSFRLPIAPSGERGGERLSQGVARDS